MKIEITKPGKYYSVKLINPPYEDSTITSQVIETAVGMLLVRHRHELGIKFYVDETVDENLKRRHGVYGRNNIMIEV
jgi:hypothetical protein